jgi:hypothetical protein
MRSRLPPVKKVARTLRERRGLLLNWFRAEGTVEGFNNIAKLTLRKASPGKPVGAIGRAISLARYC